MERRKVSVVRGDRVHTQVELSVIDIALIIDGLRALDSVALERSRATRVAAIELRVRLLGTYAGAGMPQERAVSASPIATDVCKCGTRRTYVPDTAGDYPATP